MTLRRTVLMWVGVTAAPVAVVVQVVAGVIVSDAGCKPGGDGLAIDLWTALFLALGVLVAGAGAAAAIATFRATRDAGGEPPLGRVRFLGTVGIVVSGLLLVIVVMSGIGALVLPGCVQS